MTGRCRRCAARSAAGIRRQGRPGDQAVLPYRRDMPARKRPTPEDTVTARRVLLDGLARNADIFELQSTSLRPLHPGQRLPRRGVRPPSRRTRLTGAGPAGLTRCPWRDYASGTLPECTFRGRENTKLQYAVLAAAALHGGTEPDLLDEVAWWQTDDFWQYALFAAVAYIRAAASRAGVPVRQACQDLGERPGPPDAITTSSGHSERGRLTVRGPGVWRIRLLVAGCGVLRARWSAGSAGGHWGNEARPGGGLSAPAG